MMNLAITGKTKKIMKNGLKKKVIELKKKTEMLMNGWKDN